MRNAVWVDAGVLLLVVLVALVTVVAAAVVWRNGYNRGWRQARSAPPMCPVCNYNLTGLSQCQCPECGTKFNLEQLWRSPVHARPNDLTTGPRKDDATQ